MCTNVRVQGEPLIYLISAVVDIESEYPIHLCTVSIEPMDALEILSVLDNVVGVLRLDDGPSSLLLLVFLFSVYSHRHMGGLHVKVNKPRHPLQ